MAGLLSHSFYEETLTNHYSVLRDIRQGGFAQEKLVHHLITGREVAMIVLPKVEQNFPIIVFKLDIMEIVGHLNVIQLFPFVEIFEYVYLMLEHAGGEHLLHHIA